jgi:microcystin degradation protein MlrC
MHIECGTFSPLTSGVEDFPASRGADMMDRYPFLLEGGDLTEGIEWVPLVHFRAMPGGVVRRAAYEEMKEEIIERCLEAGELDGFLFDIHGAMSVEGLEDAELDLLRSVREVIGPGLPVACSQDLHGNVSAELIAELDAVTAYRTAPHVDFIETRERAMEMLVRMVRNGERPKRAWVGIPVLLSGEMTSTEVEPGQRLWAGLEPLVDGDKVWDVSLWAGYPWADQARAMASVVVTGRDRKRVKRVAEMVAGRYWKAREGFRFLSPAMMPEEAFQALEAGQFARPAFFSDAGDNPTAGGAGDTTGVLRRLLDWGKRSGARAVFASIPDADAVAECVRAGVGAGVELAVGGKLDPVHGGVCLLHGVVRSVSERDAHRGPEAVVDCGSVSVILSARRRAYHLREDYTGLGLDPLETDLTVVKIGYLEPELRSMAADHVLLLSPGGVNPALETIGYQHLQRPIFPLDRDFAWAPKARVLGGD